VRESQLAVFVDEGRIADVFAPGRYRLGTQTLPVLTYLRHWDKLFQSPFKSDVYFFSTRLQLDRRWGTTQPVTIRDADFGAVRLRAFGNYAFRVADARRFHTEVSGTRAQVTVEDLDGQLRGLLLQHVSDAVAASGVPFLDLAANQVEFAALLRTAAADEFARLGLALDSVTVQNLSLPEELQKVLDQRIGMGMVGGSAEQMGRFMQYQTAQAIPEFARGAAGGGGSSSGVVGDALGLGAGVALGQVMAQQLGQGLQGSGAAVPTGVKADDVMATLEKLAGLKARGILTEDEFATKKAELLKKIA
jgi:membrane protease subunit (stomatin/prohibitin family)